MSLSGFRPPQLHEQRFAVSFSYPVIFCNNVLGKADATLAWAVSRLEPSRRHPVYFAVDSGVADAWPGLAQRIAAYVSAHPARLELVAPVHVVPGGEAAKNDPAIIDALHARFAAVKLDRQAAVIAIGGGGVLDAVGYAASTAHRGLRMIRLPTTVLAQNDAGVGVKTGVNAFGAKNFLGTFAPPFAVVNDAAWLGTLPARDMRAGMAEAVKVGLIRDRGFFEWIEQHAEALGRCELRPVEQLVRRCAELHLAHIASAGDPFETGSARPLDYGHWAAHKLEILSGHALRHGEAVAIGMLLDAHYAELAGLLASRDVERLGRLLEQLGLPCQHDALTQTSEGRLEILRGLQEFREHLGGELTITLLRAIGQSVEVGTIDEGLMARAIGRLAREVELSCA